MDNVYRYNVDFMVIACSTNIWEIEPSMHRYGRFDQMVFVAPPDEEERMAFFNKKLSILKIKGKSDDLVELTHMFSFADMENIVKQTTLEHFAKYFGKSKIPAISLEHFTNNAKKSKSSIMYWFEHFKKKSNKSFKHTNVYSTVSEYMEGLKL
jgi:SpoVK/Ycf46/Vps4 family AAA+-type ATPase